MEKIIQENNKKLNRFNFGNGDENQGGCFQEMIVEELDFDLPETQKLE
jgi:hypothetical protein